MVAQVAQISSPGQFDLAAAPGGKSTQLVAYLAILREFLFPTEISSKRAKILVENMERFGATNVVVTNESADRLAKVFKVLL